MAKSKYSDNQSLESIVADCDWDIVVDVAYDEIPKLRDFCIQALKTSSE